jgi:mono/diheme cytochrome c family protein
MRWAAGDIVGKRWGGKTVKVEAKRSVVWALLALLVAGFSLFAQVAGKASPGETIFRSKCVLCHGLDGSGKTPLGKQLQAADLRSKDVQKLSDGELHRIIHDGQSNMPSFADQLADSEIDQVLRQVRAFGKAANTKK